MIVNQNIDSVMIIIIIVINNNFVSVLLATGESILRISCLRAQSYASARQS